MERIVDVQTFLGAWHGNDVVSTKQSILKSMKNAGVTSSVAIATNIDNNFEVHAACTGTNGALRFGFWYADDPAHLKFLKRHIQSVELVKYHPSHIKKPVNDPSLSSLFKICERHDKPILVHCGRWQQMAGYKLLLEAAAKFECVFLMAHLGCVNPDIAKQAITEAKDADLSNLYLVTSGMTLDKTVFLSHYPPNLVAEAVRMVGADHVLFGSDYPFGNQRLMVECITKALPNNADRRKVLGENALKLFGIYGVQIIAGIRSEYVKPEMRV